MCIILACEANRRPTNQIINQCWDVNPDGGGVMWAEGGHVEIAKGLMSPDDLIAAVRYAPKDSPLVIHMRIGTSGGYGAEVTHPYPVTDRLDALHALDVDCSCGIAHNGILPYPTDDAAGISDTVYYVSHVVAPLSRRRGVRRVGGLCKSRKARRTLAATSKGSRLALLDGSGALIMVGDGWGDVTTGIHASNDSWRGAGYWYGYKTYTPAAWYDDDAWDDDPGQLALFESVADQMDAWGCDICDCYDDCRKLGPCCFDPYEGSAHA